MGGRHGGRVGGWMLPVLMVAGALAQPAAATVLPGGGPAKGDCYVTLKTDGTAAATKPNKLDCTEGDPACDTDGCGNGQCTIGVALCLNQEGLTGCTPPAALTTVKVKKDALAYPAVDSSACGSFVDEVLPLVVKRGKERPSKPLSFHVMAKAQGSKPPADKDTYTIRCLPRTSACPTTTTAAPTTSTSTSSTSSTSTSTSTSSTSSTSTTSTTETTTTVPATTSTTVGASTTTVTSTTETTTTVATTSTTETTSTVAATTSTTETTTTVPATTSTTETSTTVVTTTIETTTTVEPTTTTVEVTTTTEETTTTVEATTSTTEETTTTVETTTTTIETTTTTTIP